MKAAIQRAGCRVLRLALALTMVVPLGATLLPTAPGAAAAVRPLAGPIPPVPNAPMRMRVGSDSPLLLTQLNIGNDLGKTPGFTRNYNSGWSMAQLWASVPDELKHNIGFVLHQGHTALSDRNPEMSAEWLEDNVAEADTLGIPVFILWDEGKTLGSNPTRWTFLEHLYQTYPHFMGSVVSEQADTLGDLPKALQLANEYGGFHVLGSLEETNVLGKRAEDQSYWDSVSQYSENFIFNPKNFHENFESVNAWTQGAWMSGLFDNWGPYFDGYPYYGCGYFDMHPGSYSDCGDRWSRSMGETVSSMMLLDQWQNGATVFQLENQLDVPTTGNLYSPYFYQSILPAMRYILSHRTPTRDEVIDRTKIVFSEAGGAISTLADSTAPARANNPDRTTFFSMYEKPPALTSVQKSLWFYLRSSGRYNIIPRIPKLAPATLLDRFGTVLTKQTYDPTLMYGDARNALFDSAYPQISTGEAFVQKSGNGWLVYNTNDRDNFNEDAGLRLTGKTFTSLEMPEITPHTWAMITEAGSSIDVLLDNYSTDRTADLLRPAGRRDMEFNRNFVKYAYVPNPEDSQLRTTTLRFQVAHKPTLTISGYDRNHYSYSEVWNPNSRIYTLTVHHNGVVDIRLTTEDHEAGWSAVDGNSRDVVRKHGAREFTFDGTSVAWQVPKGHGTARVSIDGVVADNSVDLAAGGTVFRATGLSNSPHTIRVEASSVARDAFRYVPAVEQSATTIETDDFNYGSEAADESVLYGSEGWRVIDGKLKLVGFVFPFYGDTTVYNTNATVENVRYDAKVTLIHGTSGALVLRANEQAKSGYHFRLDPSRTAEGRTGTANYSCSLMIDYGTSALATCPSDLTLQADHEYDVSVVAQGRAVTAYIDGRQVLSYTATDSTYRGAGYTGVRAPQMQSDSGYRLGQFVQLDDVRVTDLDSNRVVYASDFTDWSQATGWMTETPLVFGWNEKADPRSSFTFPWKWETTAGGTWHNVTRDVFTSGMVGTYAASAPARQDFTAVGGREATWAADGNYDSWAWLRVTKGSAAGLAVRAADQRNMYQARIDVDHQAVALGTVVHGHWKQLSKSKSPVRLTPGDWTLIKVQAHGPILTVVIDGAQALTVRDNTFTAGATGLWLPRGGAGEIEDARVVARPLDPMTIARAQPVEVPADGITGRHVTGYEHLAVKTARTKQPRLPSTVAAYFSDGTKARVPVTWPAITDSQLDVATAPDQDGPSRGKFTIQGDVAGTALDIPVLVTVMPNLVTPVNVTHTYSRTAPSVPNEVPGVGTFSDGSKTWTKQLYVRWDQTPDTSPSAPQTQTITGSIGGYPWEKVTATVTVAR